MTDRGWGSVPAPAGSRPEARITSPTPTDGRVHGRPAPQYGEYAPEGWVNPVLAEQERQERIAARSEADQHDAAGDRAVATAHRTADERRAGAVPPGSATAGTPAAGRLGASFGDLLLTMLLLAFGIASVVQQFAVGRTASSIGKTLSQRYTTLDDPQALVHAAAVSLIGCVVVLALVVWWSVVRLRARKRTFWVPLLGGAVATAFTTICYVVVILQDDRFVAFLQSGGGS